MRPPEYRVRLFLSVDLTGSTAFKHKSKDTLEWIKSFKVFYEQFPLMLQKNYRTLANPNGKLARSLSQDEADSGHPRLWKTVGDEILFCCTLKSLCQLGTCIEAFVNTLVQYGEILKGGALNTKGNAWVASFPTPNCSIKPIKSSKDEENSKRNDLPNETEEQEIDLDPSKFDFLGKGIDAGFRISKNSAINTLTISPGLAILLCECTKIETLSKFKTPIRLTEMQEFKGVAGNNFYPVLTIDTCRDDKYRTILECQRKLLNQPDPQNPKALEAYLSNYLEYFEIEIPSIKKMSHDAEFSPPAFYVEYRRKWEAELNSLQKEDKQITSSSEMGDSGISTSKDAQETLKAAEDLLPNINAA